MDKQESKECAKQPLAKTREIIERRRRKHKRKNRTTSCNFGHLAAILHQCGAADKKYALQSGTVHRISVLVETFRICASFFYLDISIITILRALFASVCIKNDIKAGRIRYRTSVPPGSTDVSGIGWESLYTPHREFGWFLRHATDPHPGCCHDLKHRHLISICNMGCCKIPAIMALSMTDVALFPLPALSTKPP